MDITTLLLSLVFGTAGLGYITFGRKMSLMAPVLCGLGLLIFPYFISNVLLLVLLCLTLMAIPFFVRDV